MMFSLYLTLYFVILFRLFDDDALESHKLNFAMFQKVLSKLFSSKLQTNLIDDDSPFSVAVEGSKRLDVVDVGGAEVELVGQRRNSGNRQRRVNQNILQSRKNYILISFSNM